MEHNTITQQKGLIAEKEVELFFTKLGYMVSIPTYYHSRYDLIVDIEDKLYKVQVKTAHLAENKKGIWFPTYSSGRNNEGSHKKPYTPNEVDLFGLIWENQCYLIPIGLCGKNTRTLTFEKNPNEQVLFLKDFEGKKIIHKLINNEMIDIKKPVKQYTKDGVLVGEYTTTVEAIKSIKPETTNARRDSGHITSVINGQRKTAYGFVWKRE